MRKTVVIGLLGTTLDAGKRDAARWGRWRPTVGIAMQEDLQVSRFELIHNKRFKSLADVVGQDIAHVSPETELHHHLIEFRDPWDFEEVYGKLLDFARAYPFNPDEEDYLIHITTGTHVAQICLFLLTEARYLPGRLLQTQPLRGRNASPAGAWTAIDLDLSRYDSIASRFAMDHTVGTSLLKSGIETRNKAFNAMIEEIEAVAVRSSAPILLTGPTGAGKSQLAGRIFQLKKARHQLAGRFVEVNCATLRGDAAMSALFGHKKGSFTGATTDRPGLLKAADKGMLFLDEIGDLGVDEQAMVLRAIEEKRFLPVGADTETDSAFQLIAGTNRDLWAEVRTGRFREDLLARLSIWTYAMPGLAERREDIEPNIDYELDRHAEREGERIAFNKEARQSYQAFATSIEASWDGNFRDLGASISRMATLSNGGRIGKEQVIAEIERLRRAWAGFSRGEISSTLNELLTEKELAEIDLFDRVQLDAVVKTCRQSKSMSEAGRVLFAASRQRRSSANDADRLGKYLGRFGLSWGQANGTQISNS